jgi:glucose-6-phosphate 1-epimerase
MINFQKLNSKFSIPNHLTIAQTDEQFIVANIKNSYAEAQICLYGAQIISYIPKDEVDVLWLSPTSYFTEGKAIRGGIPVCFPWFGPHPSDQSKPQHGFGRIVNWELFETCITPENETEIKLRLKSSALTKSYWPFDFLAEMIFIIGKSLTVTLRVTNQSNLPFEYSCALHTYLRVAAIADCSILGLQGHLYQEDSEKIMHAQKESNLLINQEVDRNYLNTVGYYSLVDPNLNRTICIHKMGSQVTTVWNPGSQKSQALKDMPDDGYKNFVCIEAVNTLNNVIHLAPGDAHETSTSLVIKD